MSDVELVVACPDDVVELPVRRPASCAFGGPGLRTLYVTTARHGLPDPGPREGALFAVTGLAQGRPAHRFQLSRLHGRTA